MLKQHIGVVRPAFNIELNENMFVEFNSQSVIDHQKQKTEKKVYFSIFFPFVFKVLRNTIYLFLNT